MTRRLTRFIKYFRRQDQYHENLSKNKQVSKRTENWEYFNPDMKERIDSDLANKQIRKEETFVMEKTITDEVLEHIENLRKPNRREYIVNNFYKTSLIEAIRCILFEISDSNEDLHEVFLGAKRIGTSSVSGTAVYSKHGDVIFKIPNVVNSDEIVHEYIIGIILSKLRNNCVNFSVVYDVLTQGVPIISQSGQVVQACNDGEEKTKIAVYEYVNRALAITELTENDFVSCFIQSILALHYAYLELDFTHYDAHDENILAYQFSTTEFYIKYKYAAEEIYVKSFGKIAMFIDYGKSHIKYKGGNYGVLDYSSFHLRYGIYPDMSNPCSDQFKLIFMLIRKFYLDSNIKLAKLCSRFAGYFFDEDEISKTTFDFVHSETWDSRYHVRPEVASYMGWKPEDFIDHCLLIAQEYGIISDRKPELVLGENVVSNLHYEEPPIYNYEFKDFNFDRFDIIENKTTNINELEKNIDQLARFISAVINAKEQNSENYNDLKLKAELEKPKLSEFLMRFSLKLYGLNPTDDHIIDVNYQYETKKLSKLYKKAKNVINSLLEL